MNRLIRSVRSRITLVAVVSVVAVLTVGGLMLLNVQRSQLLDNLDATLGQRADDLTSSQLDLTAGALTLDNLAGDDAVVQIVDTDGDVLAASANAIGIEAIGPVDIHRQVIRTVDELPVEDDEYRVLSRPTDIDGRSVVIHIATNTDDLRGLMSELRTTMWIVVPIAAAVLGAVVWLLVGRTLRPVEAIRLEVAAIGGNELDRRVSAPGTGDEIDRLADTMNEMLDRQERAALSQQRFVADASHELRSPLTRMRTEIDTGGDDIIASLGDEADRMSALVDDLLHLARTDAGALASVKRPVDLDDIVLEEILRLESTTPAATLAVDRSRLSAAHLVGDPSQLRRMVRNLLGNAARHARSTVSIELSEAGTGAVTFAVSDDGDGVAASDTDRIFERFVRLDDARHRDHGGTGLGLAITRDIVERHGGTITLDDDRSTGTRFVVQLPG